MPPQLLDSQFAAFERLGDELGGAIDITRPYADAVAQSEAYVKERLI